VEEFRRIARYLEVSEANMEMGNLRCDANVSLRPAGTEALGVKTEIKNLNSFRFLEEAITWEIERQKRELEAGRPVRQITIHWDERHGRGRLSREKETAADYRYFREPNLIPVVLDEGIRNEAASDMPTLPSERMRRYTEQGIDPGEAAVLVEDRRVSDYFERVVSAGSIPVKRAADWVRNHVLRVVNDPGSGYGIADLPMTPVFLTELLDLMRTGVISEAMGPALFQKTLDTGRSPKSIVDEEGLRPPERNDLIGIVDQAINDDMESVQKFREGNEKAINRLIGLVMRHTQGRASAQQVRDMLIDRIKGV
jgi:aspartyl-tRNA(Asn)/glutamyl-tRNA(Gln) amidotransferase subunit B